MDFLKRLLGHGSGDSREKKPSERGVFGLREIEEKVAWETDIRKNDALKKSAPHVEEILKQKAIALEIVEELKDLEFEEDVKERTYKPILTSKPVYVKGMLEGLKGIEGELPTGFEGLEAFHSNALKALRAIQTVQLKQGRYMGFAFQEEILRLGTALNKAIDETERLGEAIAGARLFVKEAEKVIQKVGSLKEKLRLMRLDGEEREKLVRLSKDIEEGIKSIEKELGGMDGSMEYKEHLKMEGELDATVQRLKVLEKTVSSSIAPLQRLLRKYEKHMETRAPVSDKRFLEKLRGYQTSQIEAFSSEDPQDIMLERALLGLKEAVTGGELDLDEKEKSKTLSRIEHLSSGLLKTMLEELIDLKKKEERILEWLSKSDASKRRGALVERREAAEKEMEEVRAKASRPLLQDSELESHKREIEKMASELMNASITLEIPELKSGPDRQDL